jgi:hypothetical protein
MLVVTALRNIDLKQAAADHFRADLPPLKWSSLRYVFARGGYGDGQEEAYGSGDFGSPSFTATVSLDVVRGQALSGTGTIAFGADTFDLTLITLTIDGGSGNYGGQTGFRDNHGTDIFGGDTTIPIDSNGLIFAISNNPLRGQGALFAAWDNGGGTFAFLISGALADVFDVWYKIGLGNGDIVLTVKTPKPRCQ